MITPKTQAVIKLLNDVIEEAVKDGADAGGAYHQNLENLSIAVNNLLYCLGLSNDYNVINTENIYNWSFIKVVENNHSFKIENNNDAAQFGF